MSAPLDPDSAVDIIAARLAPHVAPLELDEACHREHARARARDILDALARRGWILDRVPLEVIRLLTQTA